MCAQYLLIIHEVLVAMGFLFFFPALYIKAGSPFGQIPQIFTLTTPSWLLTVQYLENLYINGWGIMAAG